MDLDDLLEKEGLDAAGVEDALAWARRRATELLRGVDGDPELGPLLDGMAVLGPSTDAQPDPPRDQPAAPAPMYSDLRGLQAAFLAEEGEEAAELPEVGAVLRVFKKARTGPVPSLRPTAEELALAVASTSAASGAEAEQSTPEATSPESVQAQSEPSDASTIDVAASELATREAQAGEAAAREAEDREADDREAETDEPEAREAAASEGSPAEDSSGNGVAAEATDHGLPAPPEVDLDPLAGIDFDDLPGMDEDDEEEDHTHVDLPSTAELAERLARDPEIDGRITMVPTDRADMTLPSMQAPLAESTLTAMRIEEAMPSGELTERALNPLLRNEPEGEPTVTTKAPSPLTAAGETLMPVEASRDPSPPLEPSASEESGAMVEVEDIELLDDDDFLIMEEEPLPPAPEPKEEEIPEWKRALASVQDEPSPPTPATPPAAEDEDVDLGDL